MYESDCVHILKPINRRHWTRTAALNDADDILTRMMEADGWGALKFVGFAKPTSSGTVSNRFRR